ncbi:MAG: hypothetical protein J6C97_03265 [Clostridia bacterium]|nr:hypothetical protein [Clostridia bacterium]
MIYSKQNLQNLILDFKKQKRNTLLITLGFVLLIALCVTLVFVLKHISFAILGFIISIICFGYLFYRLDVTHKKFKEEENFYADIVYSEKSTEEVEFLSLGSTITSNKRKFKLIKVYKFRTESVVEYLVDCNHQVTMEQNKRYLLTLSNNILVDYKGV